MSNGHFPISRKAGFALSEYMVTIAVTTIIMSGILAVIIYGGRMHFLTSAKLQTCAQARTLGNHFIRDVRSAANFMVGQGSATVFVPVPKGTPRAGNALKIFESGDTNEWILYYWEASEKAVKRLHHTESQPRTMAIYVTNAMAFSIEDFQGNVITNERPSEIASMTLKFCNPVFLNAEGGAHNGDNAEFRMRAFKRTAMGYQN